jgi:hypothetical protein
VLVKIVTKATDCQKAIQTVADALWAELGGAEKFYGKERPAATPYENTIETVASFLSCLAEDIGNPAYAATETLSGLINGMRRHFALPLVKPWICRADCSTAGQPPEVCRAENAFNRETCYECGALRPEKK